MYIHVLSSAVSASPAFLFQVITQLMARVGKELEQAGLTCGMVKVGGGDQLDGYVSTIAQAIDGARGEAGQEAAGWHCVHRP